MKPRAAAPSTFTPALTADGRLIIHIEGQEPILYTSEQTLDIAVCLQALEK